MQGPSQISSIGAVSGNLRPRACVLFSLAADNANGADRYLQLFNSTSAPTTGDVPLESVRVPTAATIVLDSTYFTQSGLALSSGLSFAFSTTRDTYTAATAADHCLRVRVS